MSMEPEDYVSLNQPDIENPSTVTFLQDKFEFLKRKIKNIGIRICATCLAVVHILQFVCGLTILKDCNEDKYAPAYFIIAGIFGCATLITAFLLRSTKRYPKLHQIVYPFYAFLLIWLILGTYYFVLANKKENGCTAIAYGLSYWLIITHYVSLIICMLVFIWNLSVIFALVYFKNTTVQFLAKSEFEN